jgi:hypothetical protein
MIVSNVSLNVQNKYHLHEIFSGYKWLCLWFIQNILLWIDYVIWGR